MWVNQHKSLFDCRDARFCVSTFIFIWFIVNLLQGIFTEIQEDEAYYALYGEHLAWGYYDHPPMVGLMAFLSSTLFSGTLGVRFFTIIASCLSLWVTWKIADQVRNDSKKSPARQHRETHELVLRSEDSAAVIRKHSGKAEHCADDHEQVVFSLEICYQIRLLL